MKPRSLPQNKLLHAMVAEVARHYPLVPWKPAVAREAWKRYFLRVFVHEARMEAYGVGQPDPFPVRPVPSSDLDSWQMGDLIECVYWLCAERLGLILE